MRAAAALVLALAACAPPPFAAEDLALRVDAPVRAVASGRSFPLTVVRSWARGFEPEPWTDASLAPLRVRVEDAARREEDGRFEETLRLAAYAFGPGQVDVEPTFAAVAPTGERRVATAAPLTFRVEAALRPGDAAAPELPEGPFRPAPRWPIVAAAGAALAALAAVAASRRRARRAPPPAPASEPAPPPPTPQERALAALAAIPRGADAERFAASLSAALRDYVRDAFAVRAHERTSEELAEETAAAKVPAAVRLRDLLAACDAVKFARGAMDAQAQARVVADAEAFVAASAGARAP